MSLAKVGRIFDVALYVVRNISMARKLDDIESRECDGLIFRGYSESDADSISKIYNNLNGGANFSLIQHCLYGHIGRRCLFVAEQIDEMGLPKVVGMNLYYVNKQDIQENTIHEGFIGVIHELNGRGVATTMRRMAIRHFKLAGFFGISTRISLNNAASLVSAKKIGFLPHEEYRDAVTGERRYYMVCKF